MTGFVDDTTHWVNSFKQPLQGTNSSSDLYKDTQITAQWWEQLLFATGGKLELTKCFYYPIICFDEEGVPTMSLEEDPREITIISSENGQRVPIKKNPPNRHTRLWG